MTKESTDKEIRDAPSTWAKHLKRLRDGLTWRLSLANGNKFIYRKHSAGYYETLVGPRNLRDYTLCKMEIRRYHRNATPAYLDSLFNTIIQDERLLIDESNFIYARRDGIPFLNGVYDFQRGKLRRYRKDDYYCDPVPHPYLSKVNPESEEFLTDTVESWVGEQSAEWMLDVTAYILFVYPNAEQFWLNLFGIGRNGKSSYLKMLEMILGKQKSIGIELDKITRFTSSSMVGKQLIVGRDSKEFVSASGVSLIKNLTGETFFNVEPKGGSIFDAMVESHIAVSTNYLVRSKDRSDGWYRRIIPVLFPFQFPLDESFNDKIRLHLPGIITLLARRAGAYKRGDIDSIKSRLPDAVRRLHKETQQLNDRVATFWEMKFHDEKGEKKPKAFVEFHGLTMSEAYSKYKDWHKAFFGEDEKVRPGRNDFCGDHGHFLKHANDCYYSKRTNKGKQILLFDSWAIQLSKANEALQKAGFYKQTGQEEPLSPS